MYNGSLTVKEVAERLRVTDGTVRNYIRRGELRAYRISPRITRIREEDLSEFFEKKQTAKHGKN